MKLLVRSFLFLVAAMLLVGAFSFSHTASAQALIISEFRFQGPSGGNDEFIEIYNNSDSAITVADATPPASGPQGYALMGINTSGTVGLRFVIPNGTVIPARGHFLATNGAASGYSLSGYPAGVGTTATSDPIFLPGGATTVTTGYTTGIVAGGGIALFNTANTANLPTTTNAGTATRLDAVGFGGRTGTNAALFSEGTDLTPSGGITSVPAGVNISFYRNLVNGVPQDTGDNQANFVFVSTSAAALNGRTPILGASGPENLSSPIRTTAIPVTAVNTTEPIFGTNNNNYNRDQTPVTNGASGTLSFRRLFTNNTGGTVTRLRLRIRDLTTLNSPGYTLGGSQADLRALTSSAVAVTFTGGATGTADAITLEQPPTQTNGGGLDSSLSVTLPDGALAPGATTAVNITLGVQQPGSFRFAVNIEAITQAAGAN